MRSSANYVRGHSTVVDLADASLAQSLYRTSTSGQAFCVQARTVVNATGARLDAAGATCRSGASALPASHERRHATRGADECGLADGARVDETCSSCRGRGRALFGTWGAVWTGATRDARPLMPPVSMHPRRSGI